jgi:tRNA modification GTPase
MFSTEDTIVAISTPPGRGGIGVVRISGQRAREMASSVLSGQPILEPRHVRLSAVITRDNSCRQVDRVLATYFPAPHSYTGEDVVEISGHGNPVLLNQIVSAVVSQGARLAAPGEFTLRAYLSGQMDLVQAEAVGDLINAVTPLQARLAFDQLEGTVTERIGEIDSILFDLIARLEASVDFPDEGYHFVDATSVVSETEEIAGRVSDLLKDARQGRLIREGSQVVVLGKANVGKSTLFNSLLGAPRAIVNKQPGTTRDLLTETLDLNGIPITLIDTAGIRRTHDSIEEEGITRARGALNVARFVILVLDSSRQLDTEDQQLLKETSSIDRLIVVNKIDLPKTWTEKDLAKDHAVDIQRDCVVSTSLFNKADVVALRQKLMDRLCEGESLRDTAAVSNLRHIELLEQAGDALARAAKAGQELVPEELVLADLQEAQNALEEITGKRTPEDVLRRIFEKFCVGK